MIFPRVDPKEIGWGRYKDNEGPFWRGRIPLVLSESPTVEEVCLSIVSSTEGNLDAVNMYDSCIFSGGLSQYCELFNLTCALLGRLEEALPGALDPFREWAEPKRIRIVKRPDGFRFFNNTSLVNSLQEKKRLFYLEASGKTGSWGPENSDSRQHAKQWAAAFANCWLTPKAQKFQVSYAASRLYSFVVPQASKALFAFDEIEPSNIVRCARAAYLAFAANNPRIAWESAEKALAGSTYPKWSYDWLCDLLRFLTFSSGVAIYPGRYNDMRPVLERHFQLDLPDHAAELEAFHDATGIDGVTSTKEVQIILLSLGYDLGPYGADGHEGPKTRTAISLFQADHHLPVTGVVDTDTRATLAGFQVVKDLL